MVQKLQQNGLSTRACIEHYVENRIKQAEEILKIQWDISDEQWDEIKQEAQELGDRARVKIRKATRFGLLFDNQGEMIFNQRQWPSSLITLQPQIERLRQGAPLIIRFTADETSLAAMNTQCMLRFAVGTTYVYKIKVISFSLLLDPIFFTYTPDAQKAILYHEIDGHLHHNDCILDVVVEKHLINKWGKEQADNAMNSHVWYKFTKAVEARADYNIACRSLEKAACFSSYINEDVDRYGPYNPYDLRLC